MEDAATQTLTLAYVQPKTWMGKGRATRVLQHFLWTKLIQSGRFAPIVKKTPLHWLKINLGNQGFFHPYKWMME